MVRFISIFIFSIFFFACGVKKVTINSSDTEVSKKRKSTEVKNNRKNTVVEKTPNISNVYDYIDYFSQVAIDEMKLYKIPASITIAQGILESASGKGRLAVKANNHFGIKCHDWKGPVIYHDDDQKQECFRKYSAPEYSYRDHSIFLTSRPRYSNLFNLSIDDYKGWAKGLKKAGYATDKNYPTKLISLIERYKLYEFDNLILNDKKNKQSNTDKHKVVKGDTLYSISKKYKISIEELMKNNNLNSKVLILGQYLVIK